MWETVGDRPIGAFGAAFGQDGTFYAGTTDSLYVYEPAAGGPPAGRWRVLGRVRLGAEAVLALDAAGDTLLVGRGGGFVSRSVNRGATWTDVNGCSSGCSTGGPRHPGGFFALPPGHAHAGRLLAEGGILFSDDRGATWTQATHDAPAGLYPSAYAFAVLPSGRVVVASDGVVTSDDGGESYQRTPIYGAFRYENGGIVALATPGSVQAGIPACSLSDASLCEGAVTAGVEAPYDGVYAWWTNDGGRSWSERISLPQPFDGIGYGIVAGGVALPPGPDGLGRALAVLGRGLVYCTADGGQTWAAVGRLPLDLSKGTHSARYVLLGPDGHLWVVTRIAGTQRAYVYRSAEAAEAAFPVVGEDGPASGGARLDVRPNPSSGRVSVHLATDAPSASAVVAVYDALGRLVAVLHDGPLAAGEHTFTAETASLPVGVYVLRVRGTGAPTAVRFTVAR